MNAQSNGLKRFFLSMTLFGAVLGLSGRAEANQSITIIDKKEGPLSAFVNGVAVTALPDSTDDYIHFTYVIENGVLNGFATGTASRDLLEPGSLGISDRLLVTSINGTNFFDVKFDSRDIILLPIGDLVFDPLVEDGTLQFMAGYSITNAAGLVATGDFNAQSDVESVPEPATSALMLLAFLALVRVRRRK